jgi:hypothetical protein
MTTPDELFGQWPFLEGFRTGQFPWAASGSSQPYYGPFLYLLGKITEAKFFLEFGLETGYTSYILATAAHEAGGCFYGVEIHRGRAQAIHEELSRRQWEHVILCGDSKSLGRFPWAPHLDVVFIDGEHSPQGILSDFNLIQPLLHPGAYVAIHDIYSLSASGWVAVLEQCGADWEHLTFMPSMGLGLLRKRRGDEVENWRLIGERLEAEIRRQVQPPTDTVEILQWPPERPVI